MKTTRFVPSVRQLKSSLLRIGCGALALGVGLLLPIKLGERGVPQQLEGDRQSVLDGRKLAAARP